MLIEITKDDATKIVKEVDDAEAARLASMFTVRLVGEGGTTEPLPSEGPPADDAFVEVGAARFSDGKKQTKKSLDAAVAAWKAAHPE